MAAALGGQTLNDRILAARHSISGQGLAKVVCKATTEELMGPKRKHLEYLLRCTEEPNVSIPTLANLLLERTQSQNWITVFKSLVAIHHLMCYGNERFTQYLASSNTNFHLGNFLDKSGVQGYDMSPFVRRYSKYLSEKAVSYRTVAFDFCKAKRGKDGGTLRQMSIDKLLKSLPVLHQQLDALIEFEATPQDLNNGIINSAFVLLFKDLIRLFACYNDGIINLLEKFFEMNKKQARDALEIYKKFLIRMDRVGDFLKVAELYGIDKNDIPDLAVNIGMDRSDIPDLAKAPSSLLEALEAHLASLEGKKPGSLASTPTGAAKKVNVAAAVSVLSSQSSSFGNAVAASNRIDEKLQRQLLAEEEQAMAKYREAAKTSNPFLSDGVSSSSPHKSSSASSPAASSSSAANNSNIMDLFGMTGETSTGGGGGNVMGAFTQQNHPSSTNNKASDDLLMLSGNPFSASLLSGMNNSTSSPAASVAPMGGGSTHHHHHHPMTSMYPQLTPNFSAPFPPTAFTSPGVNSNGPFGMVPQQRMTILSPSFGSDNSFINVFGTPNNDANGAGGNNMFGSILQPQSPYSSSATNGHGMNGANRGLTAGAAGGKGNIGGGGGGSKLVGGDLESSIANLTSNLNLGAGPRTNVGMNKAKGPPMSASATAVNNNNFPMF